MNSRRSDGVAATVLLGLAAATAALFACCGGGFSSTDRRVEGPYQPQPWQRAAVAPPVSTVPPVVATSDRRPSEPLGPDRAANSRKFMARVVTCTQPPGRRPTYLFVAYDSVEMNHLGVMPFHPHIVEGQFRISLPADASSFIAQDHDGTMMKMSVRQDGSCDMSVMEDVDTEAHGKVVDTEGNDVIGAFIVGCGSLARSGRDGDFVLRGPDVQPGCAVEVRCSGFLPGKEEILPANGDLRTVVDLTPNPQSDAAEDGARALLETSAAPGPDDDTDALLPPSMAAEILDIQDQIALHSHTYFQCMSFDADAPAPRR